MEEERRKRQAEKDAITETTPLVDALLEGVLQQAVELPRAKFLADIIGPQAIVSQAIDKNHDKQQEDRLAQTSGQANGTHANANVNIARGKEEGSLEEDLQPPNSSSKTRQNNYLAQKRAPTVSEQKGNVRKKFKLAKEEKNTLREPAISNSAVLPPVRPVTPKAKVPLVTPKAAHLVPKLVHLEVVAPKPIRPEVGIIHTTSPTIAVPKVTAPITTARSEAELSQAVNHSHNAHQGGQKAATAGKINNALQGVEVSSPVRESSTAQRLVADKEVKRPLQQNNGQIPVPLTAQAISGLLAKKQKRRAGKLTPPGTCPLTYTMQL